MSPKRPPVPSRSHRRLRSAVPVFAALGDETRLALIAILSDGAPFSIARLAERSPLTRQAITKHLRVLEEAGIVRRVRQGRESLCTLDTRPLDDAGDALRSIAREWEDALHRLKRFVEEERPSQPALTRG
ncbi:MAG: helix-turn-helix transcriptional regulator [Phycisphaerales bacterium]|nr:helix-turn-helix transcriptional regulator [Phycisphaerales bacterium]